MRATPNHRELGRLVRLLPVMLLAGVLLRPEAARAEEPAVAVLPFRVHSAKPIEYLGESVANLVRERLAASGRVVVLPPEQVMAQLSSAELEASGDAALRRVAGALGAAWVVSGALTELAGQYSLDVHVTPASSGFDAQALVLTAAADDELMTRVNEVAEGIVERVAGAAPPRVATLSLDGAGELAATLLPQLATRVGERYDRATLRDDLTLLRAQPGIAAANVETERGDEGVAVRFSVVRSRLPSAAPDGRNLVVDVQVRGNRRIEAAAILARVATKPGSVLSGPQVARDVREINALGFFRNVRAFGEVTDEGRILIFDVEENPVVRQISISGNENVDGEKIRDILTLTTGATLDYPLLFENRERVAAIYRAEGYYLAEVSYEIEPIAEHSVGIHFLVEENKKLKLRKITFVGNERFDAGELTEGFKTKRWRFWSYATSWFDRSGTYSEPLFLQDVQGIRKLYADAGFLQAEVSEPDVIPSPDGLEVKVRIGEGKRFNVGSIAIAGDDSVEFNELREDLQLKEGDVFNRSYLSDSVTVLTEYYTNRGFYFANVQPVSNVSEEDLVVDVIFQVRRGPLYFIREVGVSGNTVTIDPVVRREVGLVEGQLYSQRQVMLSRLRIQALGFFEEVDVRMEPTEVPEQLDMEVQVVERPTGSFSFGAGFSTQDGFVANGSLQQSNLFGRGFGANASVDFGGKTQRFTLSLMDPYFLGSDWSLGVTAFSTSTRFESFEQDQLGGELTFGHALTEDKRSRGFLRYSYARRQIDDDRNLTAAAVIMREFLSDWLDTSLMGLALVSDTRNDRFSPNAGWNMGANLEAAGLGGFAQFVRAEARADYYIGAPRWLLPRSTFVLGARIGYALPFNTLSDWGLPGTGFDLLPGVGPGTPPGNYHDSSLQPLTDIDTDIELPLSERYFLGGLGQFQLRGFEARSVGPRRPILYEAADNLFIPVNKRVVIRDTVTGNPAPALDKFSFLSTECPEAGSAPLANENLGNNNGKCNEIDDDDDFDDYDETDVIGGNKFISATLEYRFPISETLGLQGLAFFDMGNAFAEGDNLFDVADWRYGTGVGLQWFSPFGPLAVVLGFPLDAISEVEDSPVFEFSMGGQGF
ncbi:MAG: outer membrane protein assembly factor BamA [Deltaproteobacteria bacterium]|nr:outer membrane protein assembly factor BamA [Deltaproteobacteria bacterium]